MSTVGLDVLAGGTVFPCALKVVENVIKLPQNFYLATVRGESGESGVTTLKTLKFAFFCNETRLFSLTLTDGETSLLLEELALKQYDEDDLAISGCWRAIQVSEGPDAINEIGLVSALSQPLSDAKINLVYHSTFSTDLIFVECETIDKSYAILQGLSSAHSGEFGPSMVGSRDHSPTPSGVSGSSPSVSTSPKIIASSHTRTHMSLTTLPYSLRLARMHRSHLPLCTHALLNHMISPNNEPFFSFLVADDEVTLVMTDEAYEKFSTAAVRPLGGDDGDASANVEDEASNGTPSLIPPSLVVNEYHWRAVEVSEGSTGFTGVSVVSALSALLARHQVSIYYLSTGKSDYVLIMEEHLPRAKECMLDELGVELVSADSATTI
eukprot:TRINITY_DN2653_c0_g1_i2.p1 TRINITY_DN2653_c0_g1~~TRINITY_DN2653_c0_g1_i2.p1  ORF type:complete len:381 (-),score=61.95 TRINITY_DN2653_c0_g1_i2:130-1272(-)